MKEKIRMIKEKYYIGYKERIIINVAIIMILSVVSAILLNNILKIEKKQQIKYTELGNLEYKVGLKENDFYETEYLNENMEYISSLIKTIDIDVNYELKTQEEKKIKYEIIYKLLIYNENGNNILYEKEYLIKDDVISQEKLEEKIESLENCLAEEEYLRLLINYKEWGKE